MNPKINDYVKIIFRNGMQAEGKVISWSNTRAVLSLVDGKSQCIIMKTEEDIMMIQVLSDISETKIGLREHMNELEEQFEQTYEMPSEDELRLKKLAELKQMMIQQEKKIITEQIKDHYVGGAHGAQTYTSQTIETQNIQYKDKQYGTPDIFKK